MVELLQPPANRHHNDERDQRQVFLQPGFARLCCGLFITQGITRLLYGAFNVLADIGIRIHHQFLGGEQHLYLIDAPDLAHGVFDFTGAGGAVHTGDFPGVTRPFDGVGDESLRCAGALTAAVIYLPGGWRQFEG